MASHGWSYDNTIRAASESASNRAWLHGTKSRPSSTLAALRQAGIVPVEQSSAEESALQAARLLLDEELTADVIDPALMEAIKADQRDICATQEKLDATASKILELAEKQEARLARDEQDVLDASEHHLGKHCDYDSTS